MTVLVVLTYLYPGGIKPKECALIPCPSAQNPAQEEGGKTASEVGIWGRPAGGPGISSVVVGTTKLGPAHPCPAILLSFLTLFFISMIFCYLPINIQQKPSSSSDQPKGNRLNWVMENMK